MRLLKERPEFGLPRPCNLQPILSKCNWLSESDQEKLTNGALLATFKGERRSYKNCLAQSVGLTFDLPDAELFEHGQILILMSSSYVNKLDPVVEIWGNEDPGMKI